MANVEGIFYTLVMGVTLALVIGLIGVLWESKKMSKENNVCPILKRNTFQNVSDRKTHIFSSTFKRFHSKKSSWLKLNFW